MTGDSQWRAALRRLEEHAICRDRKVLADIIRDEIEAFERKRDRDVEASRAMAKAAEKAPVREREVHFAIEDEGRVLRLRVGAYDEIWLSTVYARMRVGASADETTIRLRPMGDGLAGVAFNLDEIEPGDLGFRVYGRAFLSESEALFAIDADLTADEAPPSEASGLPRGWCPLCGQVERERKGRVLVPLGEAMRSYPCPGCAGLDISTVPPGVARELAAMCRAAGLSWRLPGEPAEAAEKGTAS